METISYLKQSTETLRASSVHTDEGQDYLDDLQEGGFTKAHGWQATSGFKLDAAIVFYTELSGRSLKLWREFLPTIVEPERHSFDTPPPEAASQIAMAKRFGCFERIEIWTPEGSSLRDRIVRRRNAMSVAVDAAISAYIDPMAVGVITDIDGRERYFQIVRWGEALKSERQVWLYNFRVRWGARLLLNLLPVLAVLAACYAGNVVNQSYDWWWTAGYAVVSCIVFVLAAGWFWSPESARHLNRRD